MSLLTSSFMTGKELQLIHLEKKYQVEHEYTKALEARQCLIKLREETAQDKLRDLAEVQAEEVRVLERENEEVLKALRSEWEGKLSEFEQEQERRRQTLKDKHEKEMLDLEAQLDEAMGRIEVPDNKEVWRLMRLRREALHKARLQQNKSRERGEGGGEAGGAGEAQLTVLLERGSELVYGGDEERNQLRVMVDGQLGAQVANDRVAEFDELIARERDHQKALYIHKAEWNKERVAKSLMLKHERLEAAAELKVLRARDDIERQRKLAEDEQTGRANRNVAVLKLSHRASKEALAKETKMTALQMGVDIRPATSAGLMRASIGTRERHGPSEPPPWRSGAGRGRVEVGLW